MENKQAPVTTNTLNDAIKGGEDIFLAYIKANDITKLVHSQLKMGYIERTALHTAIQCGNLKAIEVLTEGDFLPPFHLLRGDAGFVGAARETGDLEILDLLRDALARAEVERFVETHTDEDGQEGESHNKPNTPNSPMFLRRSGF
jgi:hypothetical protein